ncbi:MAG: hypothetical protein M3N50_04715 [Pseudomonadota bacterium]|nr:hypothetical protein [Pseudomonadota bacterium]
MNKTEGSHNPAWSAVVAAQLRETAAFGAEFGADVALKRRRLPPELHCPPCTIATYESWPDSAARTHKRRPMRTEIAVF